MRKRKTMKRVFALILALTVLFSLSTVVFADTEPTNDTTVTTATGTSTDKVAVTVKGLKEGVKVTLYQIAKGDYKTVQGTENFNGYTWVDAAAVTALKEAAEDTTGEKTITAELVTAVVNGINQQTITAISTASANVAEDECAFEVGAGAYIAVITSGGETIYNPVFLTATYDEDGNFVGGTIDVEADVENIYGSTAVAKQSKPNHVKEIVGGTTADDQTPDDDATGDIHTVSVGDTVNYKLTPELPSYPSNAVDQTLLITDTLTKGLTLIEDSIVITLTNGTESIELTADDNNFKNGDKVVATLVVTDDDTVAGGEKMYFDFTYVNLISNATSGATYDITITYDALVNNQAVVGEDGNPNYTELFYTNNPTVDGKYDFDKENPKEPSAEDYESIKDEDIVYTYRVAFTKVDAKQDADGKDVLLAGATFGIYTTKNEDGSVSGLIDVVTTDEQGLAFSSQVEKGIYYIQEIDPPKGYSLNTTVYEVEAKWVSATKTATEVTTVKTYTADKNEALAGEVVGYLASGEGETEFITIEAYNALSEEAKAGYVPAYLKGVTTNTTENTTVETVMNGEDVVVGGVATLNTVIPNTNMNTLPSTGGIGTFIFTIVGCLLMVTAVIIFMVNKKKVNS